MTIRYRGALTIDDWVDANRLIRAVTHQSDPRNLAIGLWLVASFALLAPVTFQASPPKALSIGALFIWWGWWTRSADRRSWKQNEQARDQRWGEISPSGITSMTAQATSTHTWAAIHRHATSPNVFVLEIGPGQFLPFSRRLFESDADWSTACDLLPTVTPRASKLFTNLPPGTSRLRWLGKQVLLFLAILIGILLLARFAT